MREDAYIKVNTTIGETVNELYKKSKRVCQLRTFNELYNHYLQHKNSKFLGLFKRKPITFLQYIENEYKRYMADGISGMNTAWYDCKDTCSYDGFCEQINCLVKHSHVDEIYLSSDWAETLNNLEKKAGYLKNWETLVEGLTVSESDAFKFVVEKLKV